MTSTSSKTADSLWQKIMHVIWRGHCAKCGGMWLCAGHHITKRTPRLTRWAVMNGILLCATCHAWAEDHESEFMAWLKQRWPMLWEWHNSNRFPPITYYSAWQMRDIVKALRKTLKALTCV